MKKFLLYSGKRVTDKAGKLVIALLLSFLSFGAMLEVNAQCSINQTANCPTGPITDCADENVGGIVGSTISWSPPDFELNCGGSTGGYLWVMQFLLPESQSNCWLYNKVQRIGTSGGLLRLNQSTGSGLPSFVSPAFLFAGSTQCGMDVIADQALTMRVYYADNNGNPIGSPVATVNVPQSNSLQSPTFTLAAPAVTGYYRLFFDFQGLTNNKSYIDNLMIDALISGSSCTGDIDFYTTVTVTPPITAPINHLGTFFPAGQYTVTYTAYYNLGGVITSMGCSFNVNVNKVESSASTTPADCGLTNGSILLNATSTPAATSYEYSLQNGTWTTFSPPATISGLTDGTYSVNVRANFTPGGYCYILTPLSVTIAKNIDNTHPEITCPTTLNLIGCDVSAITVANSGLVYSTNATNISLSQFTAAGASATDACGVVSYSYRDSQSSTCPIVVTRTFTVTDNSGNSSSCNQTININHTQAPHQVGGPVSISSTVSCISLAVTPTLPVVQDYCGNTITPATPVIGGTYDECEGTKTYSYTYTDCAGLIYNWVYTYTIERLDFTMPANTGITVACEALAVAPTAPVVTNNCGGTITPTGPTVGGTYTSCEGTKTYTYHYADCEGNNHDWVYTYTIERLDFTMPGDDGETVACAALAVEPTPPAVTDNCLGTIIPTGPTTGGTYDGCEGTKTYTYHYADCEGNNHDWVYTYTIERLDFSMPSDDGETVACAALAVEPTPPTVTDNCLGTITPTGPTVGGTYTSCEGTKTYTYHYADCEGNNHDWVYTYTIERLDFTMPGDDGETVACAALAVEPTPPAVTDNCLGTIIPTGPTTGGTYDGCEGTKTYTYHYADCEGNNHDWVYTYTIERLDFTMPGDDGETVACAALAVEPTPPTVTDNCEGTITPTGPTIGGTYDDCEGTITYTFNYADCEGNNHDWVYTYTIERLGFTMPDDDGETVACAALALEPTPPSVTDNCEGTITPTGPTTGGTYDGCEGTITYTYQYADCEGNNHDWVYTYTIERLDFTMPANIGITVACEALAVTPTAPVVTDNCLGTITPTGPTTGGTYTGCEGTKTYTYHYADCEGNNHDWVYTYTIERDDFTMPGNDGETVACAALALEPTPPAVTDNCDQTITPTGPTVGGTYTSCEGTKTYTYHYADCEGNNHDWVYTYTIELGDFILPANTGSYVACIASATTPTPPVVEDNCGRIITPTGPTSGGTFDGCEGTRTYTYHYSDCEGNNHDWVYTYIIEREDFTMPDDDGETVACASLSIPPTAPIVHDNCGGTITPTGPTTGGTYVDCEGTKTYTYHYADCEGNNHDWVYTYTIQPEDFILPANTGSNVACITSATTPTPPLVEDNCGGTITPSSPSIGGTYDGCEGTRTYTFHYSDCADNTKDWVYTYVIEREDFMMPDDDGETVACASLAIPPTAPIVHDNCGGTITPTGPVVGGTYISCEGTKTYTYHYVDCEGNNHDWVYTYTIQPEDFILPANTGSNVACITSATTPTPPVVEDNCGGTISPTGPSIGGTYNGCEGTRTYTFHYSDCAENSKDWVYTYTIERLDFTMPDDDGEMVACASLAVTPTAPIVHDNCGGTITPTGPVVGGTYTSCEGTKTYTYHYADCEGNNHDWVYTYTIQREDFTLPLNTGSNVACIALATAPTPPVVEDNCGGTITPGSPSIGGTYNGCEGTRTYTYHYADCAGNNHDWVYTYTIERLDFTMPDNDGETVACASLAIPPTAPIVHDNCGGTITPTGPTTGGTYIDCEGTKTYTYHYADCEGNNHDWVYTYTIQREDFTMPVNTGSIVACEALAVTPTAPVVTDNCGGTITPTGPTTGGTYNGCEGTKTYTYYYADCEGNNHDWVYTYTIERLDFTMPDNDGETIACASLAVTPTAPIVHDNCGGTITPTGPTVGGTYTSCEGTKTYTYHYADCEGNNHDWVYTYTIERLDFTMPDDDGETVACASLAITPTPPIVTDNCGGTIIPTGPSIGGTYVGCEGTRTFTYHYADCEGNNHDWVYTYTIQREEFVLPANTGSSVACIDLATVPTPPVIGDNCGGTITPTGPSIGGTYNGCEGTRTYTYHYADCSEISKDWVYTYVIEREEFTIPSNTGSTVACEALAVTPTAPTVPDNCGGTITPTGPTIGGTYTNCEGTKTYTYHYADCEGNNHDWVYTYIIEREDFTIPSNTGSYVACIASATTPIPPVVEDNCGRIIIPTGPTSGGTYDGCEGTRTYTYHYADCEGNNHDWVYTYIIEREDFTMPLNTGRTVACASLAVAPTLPVVTDNCGGTIIPTGPIVGGTYTSCEGTKTYTYHYADCEGNNHDWVYTYTIEREDFTMPSNTGTTVACATSAVAPTPPVVTDNCGGTIIPTGPVVGGTYTTCEGTKTYTYHYADCEGNNHDWVYTYIIDITTPPHFTYVPGNLTIQCPATPVFGTPTAISSCGTAVNITYLDNTLPGTCPQEYSATRTWTATDCAGNTATATQTISVEDNTPPSWTTLPGALDASLDCGDETGITNATNLVPEATDNCGNVTITEIPEENCFGNDQAGSINAGQGNYFPFTIDGFNNLTADDIASISLHFTTNQGKGRAEFTLVNPSGQGIILVGPYCSDDVDCNDPDPSNQEFYTPTFYPDASGYPQWVNSNTIPQGLGNFTPWGATTSPNAGTINGLTSYVSSFEEFTGPMNGTWFVFARKQATVNGSIDFNSICMTPGACGNDNLTIKSWIATDDCGNTSAPFTQIISITDTEAPVITLPVANLALECYDAEAVNAWINTAVAIDECQGSVAVQSSFDVPADNCDETVVVTFTATDNCGNIATSTKSFTVDDNTAPEITLPAANLSMDCFDVAEVNAWLATASAVDNCNGPVNITPSYIAPAGNCDELVTVTFTATDQCNNVATATKTFTVDDNTAPQFSEIPLEKTIECPATPTFDTPNVTDNCDETPLVSSIDETVLGDCSQEYSITRTWTATDDCNNSALIEQTIHVIDNTPPVITVPLTDLVLECFDINAINAWLATASVTDECDASVTLMNSYDTPESFCDAPILVTFTATDDCGNIGTATKRFLVDDHIAPEITVPESNLSLSCYDAVAVNEWAATAYAIDNCGGDIDVVATYIAPLGNCNEEIVVTFTATDGCGNEASATKSFTVDDDLVPVLHNVPSHTTVSCDAIPAPADVTATDNCDTDVTVVYDQIKTDGTCANSYTLTRTWTATDDCNNSASCTQVITVQDTEAPVITVPPASLTMSCFDATLVNEWAATAFATDNCDEYVEVIPTYTTPLGNCEETILVTFTATDDCGNIGTASKSFTVDDNIAPEVIAPEYSLIMTCYDASLVAEWVAQATAYDNCSGSLAVSSDFTPPIDNCNETVTVTFTATDDCGNVGTSTQTFIVNDNEAPVIVAPSPLEIVCDQSNDPTTIINNWLASTYATDNCESDIQVTNNFDGVNQSCNETTTITFYASDNCGNQAINGTSTIIIIDNIPPVITNLAGSLDLSVECSDPEALSDALALVPTATDNCTLTPEIHLISETNYEGECDGEYQIVRIWNFTDDCENTSAEFVQTISIIDNTPPSWINPPVDLTVECDAQTNQQSLYTWLSSFYGEDNCSSATPGNNFNGLSDLCGATGNATVTFTLTDDCGNITSTSATYSIVDTQAPEFTYVPEPITVECNGNFEVGTPEAIDGCSTVTITYVGEVRTDGNCPNSYTLLRTWSAADECNNTSTCTQLITVQDNTPPVFTYVPENITVECDEIPEPGIATATDNCDPEVLPVYIGQIRTDGNCDNSYTLTRTWNATDDCNNTTTATQIITVIDVTPPVFTTIPENLTVECDGLGNATQLENWLNSAVATDNCGTASVTNNYTGLSNECGNTGSATVIFTATDECGLTSTTSATFTIVDTTDPLINEPADITVDNDPGLCGAQVNLAIATASDGCGSATVTNNITGTNNASGYYQVGTTTIIWTAIDECGNTSTDQTVVTVEDTENPLITCPDDITVDADLGVCNAYVNVPQPEVSDNCEIRQITNTYTHTDDASAEYPVGVTQVWWTVVDWSGNTANCMMTITVNDIEDPTIECPEDIAVNTDPGACGAYIEVPEPVANDNCSINSIINSFNGTSNATGDYPVGVTVVTWTVTDMSGNTATCSMTVTVTDNELPTIECPQDVTVNNDPGICGANIEMPVPVVDDNCGIESIVNDFNGTGNASGEYPIGTTTIVWTVTDIHGNTATCTTVVTVTDTEAPTIECPTNVEVSTDPGICGAFVTIPEPTVDDNCEINSISNDFNNTNNATGDYPVGTTTITWTVTDIHGNTTTCVMTVTVTDTEAPVVVCPPDIEVTGDLTCTAQVEVPEPEVSDNCSIASYINNINFTGNASGTYPVGTTLITWTVTDINGNITTCTTTVTVTAPPFAVDDITSTEFNTPVTIMVLDNDTDCNDDIIPYTVINTTNPSNGTVLTDPSNGSFIYTPNAGFEGTDTFYYKVCDEEGLCDTALVTITVNTSTIVKLIAVDDADTTEVNTSLNINNLINDIYQPFVPVVTILDQPKHGTIMMTGNTVTYKPDTDYTGTDEYTYILSNLTGVALPDTAVSTILIVPAPARDTLIIYNVITPDNDGHNDTWWMEGIEEYPDNEVLIFNRWGDQVRYFEHYNNTSIVWNGTNKSGTDLLPAGTYYYIVKLRSLGKVYTGWVIIHGHQ